jgi:hypothetical protein
MGVVVMITVMIEGIMMNEIIGLVGIHPRAMVVLRDQVAKVAGIQEAGTIAMGHTGELFARGKMAAGMQSPKMTKWSVLTLEGQGSAPTSRNRRGGQQEVHPPDVRKGSLTTGCLLQKT